MLRTRLALLPLLFTAACGSEGLTSDPRPQPPFRAENGAIRLPDGRTLMLRGMNVSGGQKYKPYLDFHKEPDYQRIRDAWGMSSMRFVMTWAAIEPEEGKYDETYLDALADRMSWAREAGIYVILDMHQDVYGEGFAIGGGDGAPRWTCDEKNYKSFKPVAGGWYFNYLTAEVTACYDHLWQTPALQQKYIDAWVHVAERLKGYEDIILGFDPMNEPYWGSYPLGSFEADLLQPFYEKLIVAVRAAQPKWIGFVEPASSRNLGIPTGLIPFKATNLVYSPHSYDRDAESGKGFDAAHRAAVAQNAHDLGEEAKTLGAPLWIGEFGGTATSPGIADYMDAELEAFGTVAASSCYYDYGKGPGYNVINNDLSEKTTLVNALVRPWPERVAGTPVDYAFDQGSKVFNFHYRPDPTIAAPTEISVPERVYPSDYQVECGGCVVKKSKGKVELSGVSGSVAEIRLHP
jgi:endoglycosylceramidase